MDILLIAVTGILNVLCFFIGAKVGNTVAKGKEITLPQVNPMEIHKQRQEKRQAEEEKNKYDAILRNIERYDGTGMGQEQIPR